MATILVRAFEPHSINVGDRLQGRLGHIIHAMPDGHVWGKLECLPRFWVINITGATVAECASYLASVVDANGEMVAVRSKILDFANLPAGVKNTLQTTGVLTVTKAQAAAYIKSVI